MEDATINIAAVGQTNRAVLAVTVGPDVSIIIPTINEAENLPLLLPRIAEVMGGRSYEVLIVDDNSRDATPQVCQELAQRFPLRLLVRQEPKNGLSGAVLHGMAQAQGKTLLVMDADMQHPPARIPALLEPLDKGEADFTIGSRYVAGAGTDEQWGLFRKINSRVATWLARPFSGPISDPMSGFFALRRTTYEQAQRLTPLGYKIALELMCKCRVKRVVEIPIHFGLRQKGQSKLTMKQQFRYLEHLSRLYDFTFPRLSPALKFLIATGCGWLVAFVVYWALLVRHLAPASAAAIAYPLNILVTFVFHLRYVRTQREFLVSRRPWLDFWGISMAEWLTCVLVAWWISARVYMPTATEVFLLPFFVASVTRYGLRKELMEDIRGLRRDVRRDELAENASATPAAAELLAAQPTPEVTRAGEDGQDAGEWLAGPANLESEASMDVTLADGKAEPEQPPP